MCLSPCGFGVASGDSADVVEMESGASASEAASESSLEGECSLCAGVDRSGRKSGAAVLSDYADKTRGGLKRAEHKAGISSVP